VLEIDDEVVKGDQKSMCSSVKRSLLLVFMFLACGAEGTGDGTGVGFGVGTREGVAEGLGVGPCVGEGDGKDVGRPESGSIETAL